MDEDEFKELMDDMDKEIEDALEEIDYLDKLDPDEINLDDYDEEDDDLDEDDDDEDDDDDDLDYDLDEEDE